MAGTPSVEQAKAPLGVPFNYGRRDAGRGRNSSPGRTWSGRSAYEAVCDLILERREWTNGDFIPLAEVLADGGHVSAPEADV